MSSTNKLVTTYAKSLFQNASIEKSNFNLSKITSSDQSSFSSNIFILGEELLLARAVLISSEKLKSFFKNPTYLEKQKLEIILDIFPGLTVTMKSFLKILTERSHLSLIPEISDEYNKLLLKFKNSTKVKLITATSIEENLGQPLLNSLKKLTKSEEILLSFSYNPKLLGGLILEYNSVAIDVSILKEFSLFFTDI